jgi:hypothetical protein
MLSDMFNKTIAAAQIILKLSSSRWTDSASTYHSDWKAVVRAWIYREGGSRHCT